MSNIKVDYDILNQKQTPAFYASSLATRPAFGFPGRIFIDTDTPSSGIYRDTGSAWVQVADPGAGTTGTLQQVTTNGNTTTLGIEVQGININDGAGTGGANTALGNICLGVNTTGSSNTAVGSSALSLNTTGNSNTGIGSLSLANNTTGSTNTALGLSALQLNTTASNNTAVGEGALQFNTTGAGNTSIGASSLRANTTFSFNTALGNGALQNALASNNTAIGYAALQNSTGDGNVAVGYLSSRTNTTGVNNSSLGISSLRLNTTGANNTAIGSIALQNNTTGNNNTAVGYASLTANTIGGNNTAIGIESLIANTTGNNNTAVGYDSLSANTSGVNNTAVGYDSLKSNTNGQYNVAVGAISLNVSTTGVNNTAVGYSALQLLTIGGGNVAIGYGSGGAITTGNNNYLLGGGQAITTGSYNTIIGSYGGSSALSNYIVLSDGQSNIRLFANDIGKVGINVPITDTPTGQVDIHTSLTNALVLNGNTTNNAYLALASAGVNKWRIGNTYNAGANSFDIYNIATSSTAVRFFSANNYAYFGSLPSSVVYMRYNFNVGTDLNIGFRSDSSRCRLEATNDAVSANIPIDFIGSAYSFGNNAPVLINSIIDDTINKLQVTGSGKFTSTLSATSLRSSATGSFGFNTASNGEFQIYATAVDGIVIAGRGSTNDMVLTNKNGGDFLKVATGTTTITLQSLVGTGSRAVIADASGNLSAPVSDISVKENISTIGYGLNEVLKMNPVWFNFIEEYKNYGESRQNGNIAQEMEAIIPEAVFTTPTTGKMGINYDQLHAVYIKALQELKAEIDALKNN